jgi:hypothetical protein
MPFAPVNTRGDWRKSLFGVNGNQRLSKWMSATPMGDVS